MHAEIALEHFATGVNFFQTTLRGRGAAVVTTKIDETLLTFEDGGGPDRQRRRFGGRGRFTWAISGDISAITATRQRNFQCANRVTVLLGKNQRELFQARVRIRFPVAFGLHFWSE